MNKSLLAAIAAVLLFSSTVPVFAQQSNTVTGDRATDMTADLLLVRPLSLVGTVIGTAAFIVSLPFTLPSGSVGEAGHELVGKPFEYTFNRPLGDFRHCGANRHSCGSEW